MLVLAVARESSSSKRAPQYYHALSLRLNGHGIATNHNRCRTKYSWAHGHLSRLDKKKALTSMTLSYRSEDGLMQTAHALVHGVNPLMRQCSVETDEVMRSLLLTSSSYRWVP